MKQYKYDKLLGIRTRAGKFVQFPVSYHNNPYEATAYETLETLLEHYPITEDDCFVDFGCGKGRINFYLHHFTDASVKGVEMEDDLLEDALANLAGYQNKHPKHREGIEFFNCPAEEYPVAPEDNRFYFFNPFSVNIFQQVVQHILKSVEEHPRSVDLLLYYPHVEYIYYLEKNTSFEFIKEIPIDVFYKKDSDDRVLIYRI
ncbi:class I SAM-dependent methyltransferase [Oceanobacillus alkalisoli]|uniref:class I SAM-dependent methyltransferase n=1 Tax=Oceanobacillus alkalisoli TaxID=2925113 RepID=UPI001EF0F09D|nr:class I SAM-dependent methyltransferase [Oceanobacillus alkalisoli]MCF3944335.1 class I SAM-dependent methyltransferase [Oceanobacillus alkalisoli]MCG5104870.1 class I SAM-dependent methyltransferase [Oceanobacillus alkalisoli]